MPIPLENNFQLAPSVAFKPAPNVHDDNPLLGFKRMVAPTVETARQGHTGVPHTPLSGDVQKLLGRIHASAEVAPNLHDIIRKGLQAKQIDHEGSKTFLSQLKNIQRYNRPFKLFWAFCKIKGLNATAASLTQVAAMLLNFEKLFSNQARFAYSALLLIPGMDQLAFSPLLKNIKKKWNTSQARYVSFYDAQDPVRKMAKETLNWDSAEQLRTRLILALRFFMLCHRVDLERMF